MHRLTKRTATLAIVAICSVVLLTAESCGGSGSGGSGQASESHSQQSNYNRLVAAQPSHTMSFSPTRETINFWIDTWGKPGKLAYVYLQGADGNLLGYYIFKGLPVSYCASQTPTYRILQDDHDDGQMSVPAPSIDGVYYSGGQCTSYYGRDASNNAYIEYTAGLGINVLLYDRPLPRQDAKPLGFATVQNVK